MGIAAQGAEIGEAPLLEMASPARIIDIAIAIHRLVGRQLLIVVFYILLVFFDVPIESVERLVPRVGGLVQRLYDLRLRIGPRDQLVAEGASPGDLVQGPRDVDRESHALE